MDRRVELRVFVVFHETLNPACYADLDPDEFEALTFIAVNPDVPKTYDADLFTRVVKEWELPRYDPSLQKLGYCENSAMWHAHLNGLYGPEDGVLFLQWDMILDKGSIRTAAHSVTRSPLSCVWVSWDKFGVFFPPGRPLDLLAEACNSFQTTFGRALACEEEVMYPLNNAFAVPGRDLSAVLEWAFSLRPAVEAACADPAEWEHMAPHTWKRAGVVYEHLTALAFGNLYAGSWRALPGVWHPTSHSAAVTPRRVLDAVGSDFGCGFK
jgi:hypothetical protein